MHALTKVAANRGWSSRTERLVENEHRHARVTGQLDDSHSRPSGGSHLPVDGALLHAPLVDEVPPVEPATAPSATIVSREVHSTEFYETAGTSPAVAQRTESALVEQFETWHDGPAFKRWAIRIPGEGTLLLTDPYDEQAHVLYEAKAAATRGNIRLAIGQLADYRRHIPVPDLRCAILLPERPTPDLCALIATSNLTLTYPDADGVFHHEEPPAASSTPGQTP